MADRKYCEDCTFCAVPKTGKNYARCTNPQAPEPKNPARFVARELDTPTYAASMRDDAKLCGPSAAWFEAAPVIVEHAA